MFFLKEVCHDTHGDDRSLGTLEFQLTKVSLKGHTIVVQILDFAE